MIIDTFNNGKKLINYILCSRFLLNFIARTFSHESLLKNVFSMTVRNYSKEIGNVYLTNELEFPFEFGLMFTVCDTEVVIRKRALVDAIRRSRGADRQDGGRTLSPLSTADLLHARHFNAGKVLFAADICVLFVVTNS